MNNMFLHFAYGSNMNPARMAKRCPGAIALGGAVLLNHRLAERLYADIDFVSGATVEGVLYLIPEANLARLDACEGYPKVYRRLWLEVEYDGGIYQAITCEMSRLTKEKNILHEEKPSRLFIGQSTGSTSATLCRSE